MDPLQKMMSARSGSPLTELFSEAPKLVEPTLPPPEEAPTFSLNSLFGGKKDTASPKATATAAGEDDDEDEPYVPLTAEEIKLSAESKADMWAAVMSVFFNFLNRFSAYQKLEKGDSELIDAYEAYLNTYKTPPDYDPEHPYYPARGRWEEFRAAMRKADLDASLSDYHKQLLRKAIEADIKRKNRLGKLKGVSIAEAMMEIAISKATGPAIEFGIKGFNKFLNVSNY
jgi:hypothetical protein